MLRSLLFVSLSWLAGAPAESQTHYVTRATAALREAPRPGAPQVARLRLGDVVEVTARRGRWREARLPGGARGWVLARALSRKMLPVRRLCARGRSLLARGALAQAVVYLRAALERGTTSRECIRALAEAHRARGERQEEAAVRARLRSLDRWLAGAWCDSLQRLVLTLSEDGTYTLTNEGKPASAGRYELAGDELKLRDQRTRDRDHTLFVRQRGLGKVLVARSSEELLREFCAGR